MTPERPHWLDTNLYPFTPRRFATPDGAISYLDEGTGSPVFLVHGTPSYTLEWRTLVTALRTRHRVIAADHLGFGLSDKPGANAALDVADHTRRLMALFDELDLTNVTLVVHDFGGPIGIPLALERKERIEKLVVLNSWMWPVDGDPAVQRIDRLVRSSLGRWLYLEANISPRMLLPSAFGDRRHLPAALHAQYLAPFPTPYSRAALYAMARQLAGGSTTYAALYARRAELTLPTEVVWGAADPAFGPGHLARWRTALPHAAVTELPGIGHFVAEEAPEAVLRAIDASITLAPREPLPARIPWLAIGAAAGLASLVAAWLAF